MIKLKDLIKEAKDETYFNTATDAVEYARTQAEKKGFEIDSQDWNSEITMGGRYSRTRPGVGKTNLLSRFVDGTFSIDSKPTIGV
jgi:hypothetical protein